jgi:outer membrane lipoprotein carrier protein
VSARAAAPNISEILDGVEKRYNRVRTLQVFFEQTYDAPRRGPRTETGELFLRKPGRMRWEYSSPKGKLFISDGKTVWLYTPDLNRVERTKVKESDDLRAPLAFLLGRVDFERDFKRFLSRQKNGQTWITAEPKSDRLLFRDIEFRVGPQFQIEELIITDQMNSVMSFRFASEKVNPPLNDRLFAFQPPAGAEVIEGVQ